MFENWTFTNYLGLAVLTVVFVGLFVYAVSGGKPRSRLPYDDEAYASMYGGDTIDLSADPSSRVAPFAPASPEGLVRTLGDVAPGYYEATTDDEPEPIAVFEASPVPGRTKVNGVDRDSRHLVGKYKRLSGFAPKLATVREKFKDASVPSSGDERADLKTMMRHALSSARIEEGYCPNACGMHLVPSGRHPGMNVCLSCGFVHYVSRVNAIDLE